jgi:hypothetical protein
MILVAVEVMKCSRPVLFILLMLAASTLWAQGPPFQTDDPVPVDLHHYEFYIFGSVDGTPAEIDSSGPAFEFNWGAIPRVPIARHASQDDRPRRLLSFQTPSRRQSLFCYGHSVAGQTETTLISACTGHGEKTRRNPTRTPPGYEGR